MNRSNLSIDLQSTTDVKLKYVELCEERIDGTQVSWFTVKLAANAKSSGNFKLITEMK